MELAGAFFAERIKGRYLFALQRGMRVLQAFVEFELFRRVAFARSPALATAGLSWCVYELTDIMFVV